MRIDQFDIRVAAKPGPGVSSNNGASEVWQRISAASADFASGVGRMADKAAAKEGKAAGIEAALNVPMPKLTYTAHPAQHNHGEKEKVENQLGLIASTSHNPDIKNVNGEVKKRFKNLQDMFGQQLAINSGYRDPKRNTKVGGAKKSQHIHGNAIDIDVSGLSKAERARLIEMASPLFPGIGVYQNSLHLDIAHRRGWGADFSKNSVPAWASEVMEKHKQNAFEFPASTDQGAPDQNARPYSISMTGSIGDLPQMNDNTIAGEAFNNAATQIYASKMSTSNAIAFEAIAAEHQDNPKAALEALEKYQTGALAKTPAELRPQLIGQFERQKLGIIRQATRHHTKQLEQEQVASFQADLASRETRLMQLASRAGMDEEGDKAIAAELQDFELAIEQGPISPAAKGKLSRSLKNSVVTARVIGHFENLPTAQSRAEYAQSFESGWQNGEGYGGNLSYENYNRIASAFSSRIAKDQVAARKHASALGKQINRLSTQLKSGFPINPGEQAELGAQVTMTGDETLQQAFDFMTDLATWQNSNRQARPEQLKSQIDQLKNQMVEQGATERGIEALGIMEALHKEASAAIKSNPLGWAERTGILDVPAISPASTEALTTSLFQRAEAAEAVAGHYNIPVRYFKPSEVRALKQRSRTDPDFLIRFSTSVVEGLGQDAPQALREISDEAPLLAHSAGLYQQTKNEGLLDEVSQALTLRQIDGYQSRLPPPQKRRTVQTEMLSDALSLLPKTGIAATEMADALFEQRLMQSGHSVEAFDQPGDETRATYQKALNEALGAEYEGDLQKGGIGIVNDHPTLLPVQTTADQFQERITRLTTDDLLSQQNVVSANGVEITPRQIRNATFVAVGPGLYRAYTGEGVAGNKQWIMSDQTYWTLDYEKLKDVQDRRALDVDADGTPSYLKFGFN